MCVCVFMNMYVHLCMGACRGQRKNLSVIPRALSPLVQSESLLTWNSTSRPAQQCPERPWNYPGADSKVLGHHHAWILTCEA